MRVIEYPDRGEWMDVLRRPADRNPLQDEQVKRMLADLKLRGWDAVGKMGEKFDGPFKVHEVPVSTAPEMRIDPALRAAIGVASENIIRFHERQKRDEIRTTISDGIECWQRWLPIDRVGLYIPGGTAPLISTVLMLGIPARMAGCREVVLCTPPNRGGKIDPAILYAAAQCGIDKVYGLGGVQAIGAMAYGLGIVPKVEKIFGPGNSWVTTAKHIVSLEGIAIDMPAGPSEVAIMVDDTCDPSFVAADFLSQAEHGVDSQSVMVTTSKQIAEKVKEEIDRQVMTLPRKKIAMKSLENSLIFVLQNTQEMIDMINIYAPEHLIVAMENPRLTADKIRHAGSIFLGHWSPESAGDYASGTNHTLPTSGYARVYSGLTLDSFMKSISYQELTPEGISSLAPSIVELAHAEGLEAHARAVEKRVGRREMGDGRQESGVGRWVRRNIVKLTPYSSARDEYSGTASIFMDANESPYNDGLNRYPDPLQKRLRDQVARIKGVQPGCLFLGNGSDEAIDLLIRIFCEPRIDRILTISPTYGMYEVCAHINDIEVDKVLLEKDFRLDAKKLLERILPTTKLIFLCSPNNPTGNTLSVEQIKQITECFEGVVVVDEAYMDFSDQPSSIALLNDLPNLVVLQTFSKAWGLAGVRLGMAMASEEIINLMNRVKYPYNINILTANEVLSRIEKEEAADRIRLIADRVTKIVAERERLTTALGSISCIKEVFPSDTNFLLVKVSNATTIYRYLADNGVVVRDRSGQAGCDNCIRITVGTPEENDELLTLLKRREQSTIKSEL